MVAISISPSQRARIAAANVEGVMNRSPMMAIFVLPRTSAFMVPLPAEGALGASLPSTPRLSFRSDRERSRAVGARLDGPAKAGSRLDTRGNLGLSAADCGRHKEFQERMSDTLDLVFSASGPEVIFENFGDEMV